MKYIKHILYSELEFETARSSGPGGQNVNKRSTAVTLRWNLLASESFAPKDKMQLIRRLQTRMTIRGELLVNSQEMRSQEQNKRACLEKLEALLARGFFVQKKRKKTKPTKASKSKRLEAKSHRGKIKKNRSKIRDEE